MVKKNKLNTLGFGLLTGLLIPIISFMGVSIYRMNDGNGFKAFIDFLFQADILTKLISLCLVPNLLLFFVFIWTNRLISARGVIMSMFVYGLLILILKIVL